MKHTGSNASRFFRWFRSAGILAAFVGLFAVSAFAQVETGQIAGTVKDQTGAVISGASVTVTSAGGFVRTTTTDEQGNYALTNLQAGTYDVKVEKSGFATLTSKAQVVTGSRVVVDASLGAQGNVDIVEVTGQEGIQINTETQELKTVVSERQLKELPTINRDPNSLVQLSGNVVPDNQSGRGAGFAINGQRSASTNVLLDGADNNDSFVASTGQQVPLDSVAEFTVLTSNFSAEYGRASGGIVNVATKAGTNNFHGTAYEFNRLSALASNDYDNNARGIAKGVFTRNQFGYSIGGPIVKSKLLFFSSAEFIRVRSSQAQNFLVPTQQLLAASNINTRNFFTAFPLATAINGRTYSRADAAFQQLIPNTAVGAFADAFPAGSTTPLFGVVSRNVAVNAGGGTPGNQYLYNNRIDWNLTDKTSIYGRYAIQKGNSTGEVSPYRGFDTQNSIFNNNILVSMTHTFSDRFTYQAKGVFNRLNTNQPLGANPSGPTLYMNSGGVNRIDGQSIVFPGYTAQFPGNAIPFGGPQNYFQIFQDATYIRGRHEMRFGGSYIRILDNRTFGAYQNAVAALSQANNPTTSLNNFIAGNLGFFQVAINPQGQFPGGTVTLPASQPNFTRNNRYNEFNLYFTDGWRMTNRIKANLGLRYEYYGVQKNTDQRLDSNFYFGSGSTIFQQIANGVVDLAPNRGGLWGKDLNNFAPRVGIAWDVLGDGRLSIRGGYGISYERNFGNVTFNVIQNPPNYGVLALLPGQGGFTTIPISTSPLGPFGGTGAPRTIPAVTLRAVDPNIRTAYAHSWNAAVEYQVFRNSVFSIEYAGSKGSGLYTIQNINRPFSNVLNGGNGAARLNTTYSNINFRDDTGFSNYNAMNVSFRSSELFKTGFSVTANYTWSHAIDNLSSTFSEGDIGNYGLGLLDPFNPKLDRGNADFDIRHRFVTSGIWAIPFAKDTKGIAKQVLDGWQVSYIFTARTGQHYTLYDCANGFALCPRAAVTSSIRTRGADNPALAGTNVFNYIDYRNLNTTAGGFLNPVSLTSDFGPYPSNLIGRGAITGPGNWNLDLGIYKRFFLTERYNLQFRAEMFNAFNHANLFIDGTTLDVASGTFIQANRFGRRQIQLALKFIF
jgi:hypothetical protein